MGNSNSYTSTQKIAILLSVLLFGFFIGYTLWLQSSQLDLRNTASVSDSSFLIEGTIYKNKNFDKSFPYSQSTKVLKVTNEEDFYTENTLYNLAVDETSEIEFEERGVIRLKTGSFYIFAKQNVLVTFNNLQEYFEIPAEKKAIIDAESRSIYFFEDSVKVEWQVDVFRTIIEENKEFLQNQNVKNLIYLLFDLDVVDSGYLENLGIEIF